MPVLRVLLAALLLGSSPVFAQATPPAGKVLGLDDMSCAAWKQTKSDPDLRQPYLDWARGFLSGHNYGQPSTPVAVVSNGTIAVFVDRHCAEKPTSSVDIGLMRMSDQYSGRNAPIKR
jgi:hypothetical protein